MTNENEQKESMVFYRAFFEAIEMNTDHKIKAECYKAIINYALNGVLPENDDIFIKSIFTICKPSVDANAERYKKSVENGKKRGGQPGNQNARKNEIELKMPTINLSVNKNESKRILKNEKQIETNQNETNDLTVTDTDTYTVTYTETETETETETTTTNNTINNTPENNEDSVSEETNQNFSSTNYLSHKNINDFSLKEYSSSYIPVGVDPKKFISLTNKFKQYFPNKNNELKKFAVLNEINYDLINIEQLIAKIDLSDFLRNNNNLGLEWCLLHKDKILRGDYDNFENQTNSNNNTSYRSSSKNDNSYSSNNLTQSLNYNNISNNNLTQKQLNDLNTLERYKKANNITSEYDLNKLFVTDYDALMKEFEENM